MLAGFPIIVLIFLVLTLLALIGGLIFMAIGGQKNREYSTKLMVLRIFMQAGVIICLGILYLYH